MNRQYVLRRRAERQAETRRRIVQATVELHRTLGPAETTFSAIAALAGVQRHTVYSHFPDQVELLKACSTHYLSLHPPPDPTSWLEVTDPAERLRRGLTELFGYYQSNEEMISRVLRDSERVPVGSGFRRLQASAADALVYGWGHAVEGGSPLLPVVLLATSFASWRSLVRDAGLSSGAAAQQMAAMVLCAAETR